MNIKIEKFFNRYRAFVLVEDELEPYCYNFNDDDFYELSKLKEIRCILEGDFDKLKENIFNRGYFSIDFVPSDRYRIFLDKPNKHKSEDSIKNEFRIKIIKKEVSDEPRIQS